MFYSQKDLGLKSSSVATSLVTLGRLFNLFESCTLGKAAGSQCENCQLHYLIKKIFPDFLLFRTVFVLFNKLWIKKRKLPRLLSWESSGFWEIQFTVCSTISAVHGKCLTVPPNCGVLLKTFAIFSIASRQANSSQSIISNSMCYLCLLHGYIETKLCEMPTCPNSWITCLETQRSQMHTSTRFPTDYVTLWAYSVPSISGAWPNF